jgi:hypothetical protein
LGEESIEQFHERCGMYWGGKTAEAKPKRSWDADAKGVRPENVITPSASFTF